MTKKKVIIHKTFKRPEFIIKARNHDWGGLITELRLCLVKSIAADIDEELKDDIEFLATETDSFHPFNTEDELAYDLPNDFFGSMAEARSTINEYMKDFLKEMQEKVVSHYSNGMNLAPEQSNMTKVKIKFKPVSVKHLQKYITFTKREY